MAKFKIRTLLTTVFLVLGASTTIADEADVMKVTMGLLKKAIYRTIRCLSMA